MRDVFTFMGEKGLWLNQKIFLPTMIESIPCAKDKTLTNEHPYLDIGLSAEAYSYPKKYQVPESTVACLLLSHLRRGSMLHTFERKASRAGSPGGIEIVLITAQTDGVR